MSDQIEQELRQAESRKRERLNLERDRRRSAWIRHLEAQFHGRKPVEVKPRDQGS